MSELERPHLRISGESVTTRDTEFEGGGNTYRRDNYAEHGKSLLREVKTIAQRVRRTNDLIKDRAFVEVTLAEGEKLKDRYLNLLNNARIEVLDLIGESAGYGVIKSENMTYLENRLQEYSETANNSGKSYFSFVEELKPLSGEKKLSQGLRELAEKTPDKTVKVSIESFSSLPNDLLEGNSYIKYFGESIGRMGGVLKGAYVHSSGSVVLEAELTASLAGQMANNFDSIRSIELSPRIVMSRAEEVHAISSGLQINPLEGNAKVCIFDSGVSSGNSFFTPFVTESIEAHGGTPDKRHGTFVASRVIYRDNLDEQVSNGVLIPHAQVLDVRIFGAHTGPSESELIDALRMVVPHYSAEYKVYNLSLQFDDGTDGTALSDNQVTRIASELDYLSKEYGVLFIVAAGNINTLQQRLITETYPNHFSQDSTRITPPGEAFLGLTVGSVVTRDNDAAMARVGHPAPYSRRGPGFGGSRKPDLVADGGNVPLRGGIDRSIAASAIGDMANTIVADVGTSFAAPVVSSYAAELFDRISGASPNLVKSLLIHFAVHPREISSYQRPNTFEHIGFGIPELDKCFESIRSTATFVYEGEVPQQKYVRIPFYVPDILALDTSRGGRKKLGLRVTLVWDPLTDRRKLEDYSLVHLYSTLHKVDTSGNLKKITIQNSGLLQGSLRDRFYPVTRIEKQFDRNFLGGLWQLELRMSHRWDVPAGYKQNFAVVISVADPHNKLDVYSAVRSQIGLRLNPVVRVR